MQRPFGNTVETASVLESKANPKSATWKCDFSNKRKSRFSFGFVAPFDDFAAFSVGSAVEQAAVLVVAQVAYVIAVAALVVSVLLVRIDKPLKENIDSNSPAEFSFDKLDCFGALVKAIYEVIALHCYLV